MSAGNTLLATSFCDGSLADRCYTYTNLPDSPQSIQNGLKCMCKTEPSSLR